MVEFVAKVGSRTADIQEEFLDQGYKNRWMFYEDFEEADDNKMKKLLWK